MQRALIALIVCPALALVVLGSSSCTAGKGVNAANTTSSVKSRKRDKQVIALGEAEGGKALEDRFAFDTRNLKRDNKGNFKGAVRSQYEGQKNLAFGGGVGTSAYKTNRYQAPQWSGDLRAPSKVYGGNLDGSRFQTQSRFQGTSPTHLSQRSRFQGARVSTDGYRTGAAHEGSAKPLAKPSDGWTDFRRRVFPQPGVISKEDYDKLTAEQYRSILGRDE